MIICRLPNNTLFIFFLWLASTIPVFGLDLTQHQALDLGLTTGVVIGTITEITTNEATGEEERQDYGYGGIPFGMFYTKDFLKWLSASFQVHFVIDLSNVQITRTGFDLTFAFHLLGGSRRLFLDYGDAFMIARNPFQLSLLVQTGFFSYNASSATSSIQIEGSIFENKLGLQYRLDLNPQHSLTFSVLMSIFNLPASLNRYNTNLIDFGLGWRFFI